MRADALRRDDAEVGVSERRRAGERGLRAVPVAGDASPATASDAAAPDAAAHLSALLVSTGRGSTESFEALFDHLAGAVHGLALRIVRDPHLAEDVAQEAMVEVWRQAARYRPDQGSARAWVLTIAHRRAVDRVRSEQSHADRLKAHGAPADPPREDQEAVVEALHHEWQRARLTGSLAKLTERQREAVELTYYKGYTNRELAEALDIPLGTAKARIRDALIRLRDLWEVNR